MKTFKATSGGTVYERWQIFKLAAPERVDQLSWPHASWDEV